MLIVNETLCLRTTILLHDMLHLFLAHTRILTLLCVYHKYDAGADVCLAGNTPLTRDKKKSTNQKV